MDQRLWLSKLNTSQTGIHFSADILQMSISIAAVKTLSCSSAGADGIHFETLKEAQDLAIAIKEFIASMESWTAEMIDRSRLGDALGVDDAPHPFTPSSVSVDMFSYRDRELALLWNFHAASQIVLRESLVQVLGYSIYVPGNLENEAACSEVTEGIRLAQEAVEKLSSSLLQSISLLMGFSNSQL